MKYPIYNRQGEIRCYTLIDKDDFDKINKYSWSMMGRGYIKSKIDGKNIYLHRFIVDQYDPKIIVDHINKDPLDNRKKNLRTATLSENAFNRKKSANKSSEYKGVSFDKNKNKWQAYFKIDQVKYLIGYFDKEKIAAKNYDHYARKYYGDFAFTNFKLNGHRNDYF